MTMRDNSEFSETLSITLDFLKELLEKKNRDYGTRNLLTFGNLGILVRLSDKLERLKNEVEKLKADLRGKDNEINDLKALVDYLRQFRPNEEEVTTQD